MVKLNHLVFRELVAVHCLTQEQVAEQLDISVRHVRNLCKGDMNPSISLCYNIAALFNTTIEELLIIQDEPDEYSPPSTARDKSTKEIIYRY